MFAIQALSATLFAVVLIAGIVIALSPAKPAHRKNVLLNPTPTAPGPISCESKWPRRNPQRPPRETSSRNRLSSHRIRA
jgi:hypothetical protein